MTNYRNLSPGLFPTFLVVLLVHIICHAAGMARDLTPQEKRGKEIYLKGTSPSGQEITARLGNPGVEVPASLLPCVNCHGADGRGKPEGGIIPSDLTQDALTKPYTTHKSPPYTEQLLKRAITTGINPAGDALNVAMPRYRLSPQDLVDPIAYLLQIGKDLAPGVSETGIQIGVLLPPIGQLARLGWW